MLRPEIKQRGAPLPQPVGGGEGEMGRTAPPRVLVAAGPQRLLDAMANVQVRGFLFQSMLQCKSVVRQGGIQGKRGRACPMEQNTCF